MNQQHHKERLLSTTLAVGVALAIAVTTPAAAQTQTRQTAAAPEEIIVTARKREESIMKTPVVLQAFTAKQIEDLHLQNMNDLSTVTPGLIISPGSLGVGALVYLRGLGNGDSSVYIDQSVALNVDGATMSQGNFYKLGLFDIAQVEVMKGPQGLFFGKSTSAGIIAVHSADPTDKWETKATVGYEFEADEMDLDGVVSGPITDKVGIRIAGFHNTMKGWLNNANPADPRHRLPNEEDDGGRLTLSFKDTDIGLRAKLKVFASHMYQNWWAADRAQLSCPASVGHPQKIAYAYDNCKLDDTNIGGIIGPPYAPGDYSFGSAMFNTNAPEPIFRNGVPYTFADAHGATLDVDYDIAHGLTLSSVSAMTGIVTGEAGTTSIGQAGTVPLDLSLGTRFPANDWSQELRLTSDWKDSWINFIVGAYYDRGNEHQTQYLSIPFATTLIGQHHHYESRTVSEFGQLLLTPIEKWELSLGVRHTHVRNWFTQLIVLANFEPAADEIGMIPYNDSHYSQGNTSPEVTLTYRPTDDVTAFLSYKQGYKGPGFNLNSTAASLVGNINPFGGEKVRGFEGGIKASLLDRHLTITATGYHYKYLGQQVSFVDNITLIANIINGDNMELNGAELGVTYHVPQIDGLTLNGFVNYNHAEYTYFPRAACYGNQTVAEGCIDSAQDLKGRTPYRAPRWTGQFGGEYRADVTGDYQIGLTTNWNFSSSYYTSAELGPTATQKAYLTIDAAVRFGKLDGPWEIALIGRDLNNTFYSQDGVDVGGVTPGVPDETYQYIARPRQILLQLTVRPDMF